MWQIRVGVESLIVRLTRSLLLGLGILGCTGADPGEALSTHTQAQGNTSCVTVTFDYAPEDRPVSYHEAGVTVTSRYPSGPHLHLEFGPYLYNHSGCCSTPYRFELSSTSTFGPSFRVERADFLSSTGTHSFRTSTSPDGVTFSPGNGASIPFPSEFSNITWFEWDVSSGSRKMDNLVICPASAHEGTCEHFETVIGHPVSEIARFAVDVNGVGSTRCEAAVVGADPVDATALAQEVAISPSGAGATLEHQKHAACAVLNQSLLLCKNGTYHQASEPLVTRAASCHPNAELGCVRHEPDFAEIFQNAGMTFSGGTTLQEHSYCSGQVTDNIGYSMLTPTERPQWTCTDAEINEFRATTREYERVLGWRWWPFNIKSCDGRRAGSESCNLCRVSKALINCVLPNLGPDSECDVPGTSDKGRRYDLIGDYCFRMVKVTGGIAGSAHSAGRAFDLNNYSGDTDDYVHHNNGNIFTSEDAAGEPVKAMNVASTAQLDLPPKFVSIMEACGFDWGGRWWTAETVFLACDPMHFELP